MKPILPPAALLSLLTLFLPDPAFACSCGYIPRTYAQRRLDAQVVFHGKVEATEADEAAARRWIRFAVIKDYSLDGSIVADTATVWTALQSSACGVHYPVGEEVLVFADNRDYSTDPPRASGPLSTGLCSMNIAAEGLAEALRGMDEAVGVLAPAPRAAAREGGARSAFRAKGSVIESGQILFEGKVRANGARRGGSVER